MGFAESYLGQLRAAVGSRPLLVIGVRVLIEDAEGRIVIVHRTDTRDWGLPAGSLELGESLTEAIHREAFEEANARLEGIEVFGISSDPVAERFTYPNGDQIQNVSILARARLLQGRLHANDGETGEVRLIAPEAIEEASFTRPEWPSVLAYLRWKRGEGFQFF